MTNPRRLFVTALGLTLSAGLAQAQISENFDTLTAYDPTNPQGETLAGWSFQNSANPQGTTGWYNGGPTLVFPPQASTGFLAANYNNCTGTSTISSWAVTPMVLLQNGQSFTFYARTVDAPAFPDRLQVRMSTAGTSTNVGALADPTAVGDFTTLLLDINPTYTLAGFPNTWTQYTLTLSGLPGAGVNGRFAYRYFVEGGGPTGANSDFIGIDEAFYGTITVGACCFPDGSCTQNTSLGCTSAGGTYSGDNVTCAAANCPQPATGKCCTEAGSCSVISQIACTAAGGVYGGDNTTCAVACVPFGYTESGDAGETLGTAAVVSGPGGAALIKIHGNIGAANDSDLYKINICDEANFSVTTVGGTTLDTQLFLFNSTGFGVAMDDDDTGVSNTLQSRITTQFVTANGDYYVGISGYNRDPVDAGALLIWANQNPGAAFGPEWIPNGPGAANALAGWDAGTSGTGAYTITLTGSCFVGAAGGCYANCDNSTAAPVLNSLDFGCFLTKFAAGDTYANCDLSTAPPVLNALDFGCFLTKFAGGCT